MNKSFFATDDDTPRENQKLSVPSSTSSHASHGPTASHLKLLLQTLSSERKYQMKSKSTKNKEKMTKLFEEKRLQMLHTRLNNLKMRPMNRYAMMGDEYKLRRELETVNSKSVLNSRDSFNGRTVLHEAVAAGHYHLVRSLCNDFEIDIDQRTVLGENTALHIAVEKNFRSIASILLSYGADVNAQNDQGETPMHLVKKITMVRLLLRFEPNMLLRNFQNQSPLDQYLANTRSMEQEKDMIELMKGIEDSQTLEESRLRLQTENTIRERMLLKQKLIISANSTVNDSIDDGFNTTPPETPLYDRKNLARL